MALENVFSISAKLKLLDAVSDNFSSPSFVSTSDKIQRIHSALIKLILLDAVHDVINENTVKEMISILGDVLKRNGRDALSNERINQI